MTLGQRIPVLALVLALAPPLLAATLANERPPTCQVCVECASGPVPSRVLRLKIYNQARLNDAALTTILGVTNGIWDPYGVRLEAAENPDAVAVVVFSGTMSGRSSVGGLAMGDTLFMNGHATPYIRLYLGAAKLLAENAETDGPPFVNKPRNDQLAILTRMLGVALAHEIGHYLLDTSAHSAEGLLRSIISARDLEEPNPAHLRLTHKQLRLLLNTC